MKSLNFPKMFNSNSTNISTDDSATKQNLLLLLGTEKGTLTGDPYFGVKLRGFLFDQNNIILKDVLIEEIYTQIAIFMPQIKVNRNDIRLFRDRAKLICKFKAINTANYENENYDLVLYNDSEDK